MATIIFDTLKFVKKLKTAGMPEKQAQALSEALQDTHLEAELATKSDIKALELVTKADIKALERNTKHDIKELELSMHSELVLLKWMLSFLLAGTIALVARSFLH